MFEQYFSAKERLYPQQVKGKFRRLKWVLNFIFLTIYLFSPYLRFDRGASLPNQAILIDLPGSRAYFFAIEIWPDEVYYLMGILIIAAITLFFITSLFGRIWCGYACFQTVWTDIFIAVEKLFQGDRNERILLDRKNSFKKFYKKFLTHFTWLIIALITGYGFVGYFNDSFVLIQNLLNLQISFTVIGWIMGIAAMTYIMAGFAREHVCTYMCPYARFQSAMFDDNTLIISYDEKRGEQRGKMGKNEDFSKRGHCIDCKQCVVVCPQGIDIRNGLQMECIACGLCIDACDGIMDKIGLPRGLIRYDTLNHLHNPSEKTRFRFLQPRTFLYSTIILLASSLMIGSLLLKSPFQFEIIANRNPVFVKLSDGSIRNGYELKITNKTHEDQKMQIFAISPSKTEIKIQSFIDEKNFVLVNKNSVANIKIYATLPSEIAAQNKEGKGLIKILISNPEGQEIKKLDAIFISQ